MAAVPAPRATHLGGASHAPKGRIKTAEEYTSDPDLIPLYRSLKATQEAMLQEDNPSPSASQQLIAPAPVITPEYLGEAFALALSVLTPVV